MAKIVRMPCAQCHYSDCEWCELYEKTIRRILPGDVVIIATIKEREKKIRCPACSSWIDVKPVR